MASRKVLNGRVATEADVNTGSAVFFIPDSRSVPYKFDCELPLLAKVTEAGERAELAQVGSLVPIVQADLIDGKDVVLGLIMDGDAEGICTLEDVELLKDSAPVV